MVFDEMSEKKVSFSEHNMKEKEKGSGSNSNSIDQNIISNVQREPSGSINTPVNEAVKNIAGKKL